MEHSDRAARQGANIAWHLNQSYPDTVLFLAWHAGGRPHAIAAEMHTVDDCL